MWCVSESSSIVRDLALSARDTVFLAGWHLKADAAHARRSRFAIRFPDHPVLMLPGVYESPRFLDPLAEIARSTLRPVHTVPELGRNRSSIEQTCLLLADYLEQNGLWEVTIVAHSKGGLAGKRLMLTARSGARIRSMIAIATPFGGTRYATRAPTRALRDFAPHDPMIRALAGQTAVNSRILAVRPRHDAQIPDAGPLPGARNVTLAVSGHFRVLGDRQLHALLRRELVDEVAGTPPSPPAPA